MEGTGMVAIVQGLRDAGLTVTMLSRRFGDSAETSVSTDLQGNTGRASQSAVDTATETALRQSITRDIGYRSSYQLAYCSPSGSSAIRNPQYAALGYQQYRGSPSRSHDEEAFVDSLRKYPDIAPIRSRSADLVERMLLYTQNKNDAKRNANSRSANSLPPKETAIDTTYDEIPTRDSGVATNDNVIAPNFGYKRDVELTPAPRRIRYDNDIGMYNYLKSGKKDPRNRHPEVRYLTNVKQCLRQKLREICETGTPTICPKIQSRYSQHRRQHHKVSPQRTEVKEPTAEASSTTAARNLPCTGRDRSQLNSSSPFKSHKSCFCNQPSDCHCDPRSSPSVLKPRIPPEDLTADTDNRKQYLCSKCMSAYERDKIEDVEKQKLREQVLNWLSEIPVYANFCTKDDRRREETINELIDTLGNLQHDESYMEKAEQEILKCLKVLPMWHPESKQERDLLNNQLTNKLLQRLKCKDNDKNNKNGFQDIISEWVDNLPFALKSTDKEKIFSDLKKNILLIAEKPPSDIKQYKNDLKYNIVKILNDFPIESNGTRTTVINELADKLAENLVALLINQQTSKSFDYKDHILDWVKQIPQFLGDIILDDSDQALVTDLIMRLSNLQIQNNKIEQMKNEITNWLNTLQQTKKCQIDEHTKNLLINQLISKLQFSMKPTPSTNIKDVLKMWVQDIPNTIRVDLRDIEMLAEKLEQLNMDNNESRQSNMRKEILNWLQIMQRKQDRYVDNGTQENLVNKLMSMIRDDSHNANNYQENENDFITQKIWNWLKSQPNFQEDNTSIYRDMVTELSEKLQNMAQRNDLKVELSAWFKKINQNTDLKVDSKNGTILEDQLVSCMKPSKRRKHWDTPETIRETVMKEVSNIIKELVIQNKENITELLTKKLTKDLNTIQSIQSDKHLSEIINVLKQETSLSENEIKKIAHNLITKVKEAASLQNMLDTEHKETFALTKTFKDKLRDRAHRTLKNVPIGNKREVIETLTDILINVSKATNGSDFDAIYETLKKADVDESEALDKTNKLLNILDQLRNDKDESDLITTYKSSSQGSIESILVQKQIFMQKLEREITQLMAKVLLESSSFHKDKTTNDFIKVPHEESASQNDLFKHPPLKTSTPKSGSQENTLHVNVNTEMNNDIDKSKQLNIASENEYKSNVKALIRKWLSDLKLSETIDDSSKDEMANEIANDIIDRGIYIKFSKIKSSYSEEIEHLKYQIFKWTSKLPELNRIATKTSKIKELIKSLETAEVPYLFGQINEDEKLFNNNEASISEENNSKVISQNTSDLTMDKIYGAISTCVKKTSILRPKNSQEKLAINNLITELSRRLRDILRFDPIKMANIKNMCREEIVKQLRKLDTLRDSEELFENVTSELIKCLNSLQLFDDIAHYNEEVTANNSKTKDAIKIAVQNWCRKLPLKSGTTYEDIEEIVNKVADAISKYLLIKDTKNLNIFMDDILSNLKELPVQFDKAAHETLPEFTDKLIDTLKAVLNDSGKYYSSGSENLTVLKPASKKAAELMYDTIQNWCENLPLNYNNEDIEKADVIKQNVAAKLLKKVGELNLDPEIFHDDFLYKDLLDEEIQKILEELPNNAYFPNVLPALKENLIKDIIKAKERIKNDMAGYAYKQQLRDAISKTLSSIGLSETDETPFETLKDNLADAFISLHYVANDEELKKKYRDKIFNEVNRYCNDYLKRYPSSPLNANQLNQELYNALKKVPMPKDESIRREVEQIRLKDIVTDWFKALPIDNASSSVPENKIISVLTKRLHEIEKLAEYDASTNVDEMMKEEISKWLKKLNMKDTKINTDFTAKDLIDKLKATQRSRKLDESTFRKSIDFITLGTGSEKQTVSTDVNQNRARSLPTCLCADDRVLLHRIRKRTSCERNFSTPNNHKDVLVTPVPTTSSNQREALQNNINISQNQSIQTMIRNVEQPKPITPQVIVKEYYWDSSLSPPMQHSGSTMSSKPSPVTQTPGDIRQEAKMSSQVTSHVTTASQTLEISAVTKTSTTEEGFTTHESHHQNPEQTETSGLAGHQQAQPTEVAISPTIKINASLLDSPRLNDELYLTLKGRGGKSKPCQPCNLRPDQSSHSDVNPDDGPNKTFGSIKPHIISLDQQNDPNCAPDCRSRRFINEDKFCWNNSDDCNQSWPKRRIYHSKPKDFEYCNNRKRKNPQPCSSSNKDFATKCTLRPYSLPCQQCHKSCNAFVKHCPKCWDGFCPHPSYLYFRRD